MVSWSRFDEYESHREKPLCFDLTSSEMRPRFTAFPILAAMSSYNLLVSFLCWNIWKSRSELIYQSKYSPPHVVISSNTSMANEYWEANHRVSDQLASSPQCPSAWHPPPVGFVKINCDAAWIDPPSLSGIGAVIRDHQGSVVGGLHGSETYASVPVAEAKAILEGINIAIGNNLTKVIVESDALEVIEDLNSKKKSRNWLLFPVIEEIRNRSRVFSEIKWEWIPREANSVAHTAASLAIGKVGLHRWANVPPPSLIRVLKNDGLPCPPAAPA